MNTATATATTTTATELTDASRAVILAYVQTLTSGDLDALRPFFAPGVVWKMVGELPISGTWTGADEILEVFIPRMISHLHPETLEFSFDGLISEGDRVLAEWNTRAVARAGGQYDQHCLAIFTVRDGLITEVREYFDTLHAKTVVFP